MKNTKLLIFGLVALVAAHSISAAEIGVSGMFAQGGFDHNDYQQASDEYDYSTGRIALLVDNPIKPYLNYRVSLGLEGNSVSSPGGGSDTLFGLGMTHTFAFNVFKRPTFRIWMGPQLRAVVYKGDGDRILDVSDNKGVSFGIGPEVGFSYRYNQRLNLGASLALVSGDLTFDEASNTSITSNSNYRGGDVEGSTYGGHFSLTATYNFGS